MTKNETTQTSHGTFWNRRTTAVRYEAVCCHDEQDDDTDVTWDILEQKKDSHQLVGGVLS